MLRFVLFLLLLVWSCLPATCQGNAAQTAVTTLKANARLVVVDVVVTDKNQNPVHDLKQSDFSLLEGNAPQSITHFEEHRYPALNAQPVESLPPMPPGMFTNFTAVPPSSSLNILLLDTLNTPMTDQAFVRDQLKNYLKKAQPGIPTAIFGLTSRLIMLQGFTSNPDLLKALVEKKVPGASPLLNDAAGTDGQQSLSDQFGDVAGNDPNSAQILANLQQFEAQEQSFQLQLRAKYTLDAMNLLARYLSGLPGRKNLIWFSGSFPISVLPDGDLQNPFATVASYEDEFLETTNLFTTSQVAVYPVDARGLMVSPNFSASNSGSKYVRNPRAFGSDETKFFQQTSAEHSTMLQMAEQTGGHAFINTNGLTQAIATAITSGSNYYTLAYTPTDPHYDGRYRKIRVHLQQGQNLSYRRGYYAVDPDAPTKLARAKAETQGNVKGTPVKPPPTDIMRAAMTRGAPNPSGILFKVRILPAATTPEATLVSGNEANPDLKLSHGPYRRYVLEMAADPRAILFTHTSDALYHGDIQVRAYVYNQDGALIIDCFNTAHATIDAPAMQRMLATGIQMHQQISVPEKGTYFLRIGIHDLNSDRLGAVEVPIATVKNLPPLAVPDAAAPPKAAAAEVPK
ncbi:MAG: VWFA-related domain protein [Acidobacteriaceae bacterium]|nr:VWFA-related domain protein [Acidobacteriaceae bacterium]